jgi:SSS family solute:Na+ symporter
MSWIDWVILAGYALATLWMGWWVSRKQESGAEYFTGSGSMNPLLVGVSLFATLLSTITYLAIPGEVLGKGPMYLANYLVYPFVYWVITRGLLPVYMRLRVTSAYELLEQRLGLSLRMLAASLFVLLRLVWMSLLIYLTSKALTTVMELDSSWVPVVVAVTGAFSITYTTLGGLRAVVITDLMQTLLLYGGALLVIAVVTVKMGGFGWWPTQWPGQMWEAQPLFSLDPSVRVTVVGSMISVLLWLVATSAGDQVSVQRFMATRDVHEARRAVKMQLTVGVIVGGTLGLVGVVLLGFFSAQPELLPVGKGIKEVADQMFPLFIREHLPPVVTGLVVAGLFAAAMSSVDSGVNSITAVVMTDFVKRLRGVVWNDLQQVHFSRIMAVGIGVLVVLLSSLVDKVPGNFLDVTNKTVNLLSVPIALLFVFALFKPRGTVIGAWAGVLSSIAAAVLVGFSGEIFGFVDEVTKRAPVSFQWIPVAAFSAGLGVEWVVSRLTWVERRV